MSLPFTEPYLTVSRHRAFVIRGLPTVRYLADSLILSPKYLSNLLRVLTGRNAQQHIHEKLIEKAKEQFSTTDLSVGEIAIALSFEHLQSFTGTYGPLTIFLNKNKLFCKNSEVADLVSELKCISNQRFGLHDTAHIKFIKDS